jgi:hypothetical protein
MRMDIKTKQADYIYREEQFNHPGIFLHTGNEVNRICNNHFTGSPLWDLFSRDASQPDSQPPAYLEKWHI